MIQNYLKYNYIYIGTIKTLLYLFRLKYCFKNVKGWGLIYFSLKRVFSTSGNFTHYVQTLGKCLETLDTHDLRVLLDSSE
jgi:hypothetical protein